MLYLKRLHFADNYKPCPDNELKCSVDAHCVYDKGFGCICKSGYTGDGIRYTGKSGAIHFFVCIF